MPKRKIQFQKNIPYHIYNRGYNKQQIFFNNEDFKRFYKTIQKYKIEYENIEIQAYCFLPNHFHLLVIEKTKKEKERVRTHRSPDSELEIEEVRAEEISDFMKKIQQSYAMYFNREHEDLKKGLKSPIFEGRFKAREITDEAYLSQVHTYIEYNAVKHGIVKNPEDWAFTSFDLAKSLKTDFDFEDSEFDPCFE